MKELNKLIVDLRENLKSKIDILEQDPNFNAHTQGEINNLQVLIDSFESSAGVASRNIYPKNEIIKNFKVDYDKIMDRINQLSIKSTENDSDPV